MKRLAEVRARVLRRRAVRLAWVGDWEGKGGRRRRAR